MRVTSKANTFNITDFRALLASWRRRHLQAVVRSTAAGYGLSLIGVAAITRLISLLFTRWHIANISMIYLLLVLALAVLYGSGPAVVASIAAFLAFDWFFVQPTWSLTIRDPDEWLALVLFLVTALITGQLAGNLRSREAQLHRRARELEVINDLTRSILLDVNLEGLLRKLVGNISEMLQLSACRVLIPDADGRLQVVARWGTDELEEGGYRTILPLMIDDRSKGVLIAQRPPEGTAFTQDELRVLRACADQVAVAMERDRLAAEEKRAALLEESDRMKSALLSSISHELRTPLSVIRTAAGGILEADGETSPDVRELALSIDREAERLNHLVGNLLDMSRIEAGVLRPNMELQALDEIIGAVLQRMRPLLGDRQVRISIPPDLPLLRFDALQIDQVLTNLLDNACKFSPEGSEIQVGVSAEPHGVRVVIRNVASHSLSDESLSRVFDKFYRASSASLGSGLGLTISKAIVEAHGGMLQARKLEDDWVEFAFTLPLDQATKV